MDAINENEGIDIANFETLQQIINQPHPLINFPQNLREQKQWIVWKLEPAKDRIKLTKVPYSTKGYKASSIKSEDWTNFTEAWKFLTTEGNENFNGLGYVFAGGITGIDLDNCFAGDNLKSWAEEILNKFESYTEISPSGKGLHIFLATEADFSGKKKYIFRDPKDESKNEAIECYSKGRYFTVTGNVYKGHKTLNSFASSEIYDFVKTLEPVPNAVKENTTIAIQPIPEDNALIEAIGKKRNGSKFQKLYFTGDWKSEGYGSQSEADMGLVSILMFFCRNDTTTVDRIFRGSKLMRDKWERTDYKEGIFKKCFHLEVMDWNNPNADQPEDQLIFRNLATIVSSNVKWLWPNRLAKGKLALWQGEPGQGKSQITIAIAATLSNGGKLPDKFDCEQGDTLFITAEDEASDTIVPRLMAAGANLARTHELQWLITREGKKILFNFDKYLPQLKQAVNAMDNLKLIVVDPISAFLGKVDSNASGEVRGLLYELKMLAEERNASVILVLHNNKTPGQRALSRASGSNAFGAAVRLGHVFGPIPTEEKDEFFHKDNENEKIFVMASTKNNLGPMPSSLLYKIVGMEVFEERNQTNILTSKIEWLGEATYSAQEVVDYMPNSKKGPGRPPDIYEECLQEMKRFTKNRDTIAHPEPQAIKKELAASYSENTIRKAQKELGYVARLDEGKFVTWIKGG